MPPDRRNRFVERVGRYWPAVDDEALAEIHQVRRRIPRRSPSRGSQRRVDHRGDGSFAVRARDVNRPVRALGTSETLDDRGDVLESELDPELLEAEEVVEVI